MNLPVLSCSLFDLCTALQPYRLGNPTQQRQISESASGILPRRGRAVACPRFGSEMGRFHHENRRIAMFRVDRSFRSDPIHGAYKIALTNKLAKLACAN